MPKPIGTESTIINGQTLGGRPIDGAYSSDCNLPPAMGPPLSQIQLHSPARKEWDWAVGQQGSSRD